MVIFFAKINLNSKHIYDIYDEKISMKSVLDTVMATFKSGTTFTKEIFSMNGTEVNVEQIKYKLHIADKNNEYIRGCIYKDSTLRFKVFDDIAEELKPRAVKNTEAVDFYFDVYNEMVGYNTAQRLGHREFLEIFEGILNQCLQSDQNNYEFTVNLYCEGLDVDEIESELKEIYNIKKLKFKFQPPNPDDEKLSKIEHNAEETINDFREANIATKSVIFTASKIVGLNINAKEIQEQLLEVNNLHSNINSKVATKNGYVEIEATDSHGNKHITGDKKPVKKEIDNIIDFEEACKSVIRNRGPKKE